MLDPHRQPQQVAELALERGDIGVAAGAAAPAVRAWSAWRCARAARSRAPTGPCRRPDRPALGIGRADQRAGMAHRQRAIDRPAPHRRRKFEQSQQVGDMAARLVDELGQRVLGMAEIADQPPIGLGLLDRVEVLALDILDQRDLERLGIVEFADDRPALRAAARAAPRASGARRRRSDSPGRAAARRSAGSARAPRSTWRVRRARPRRNGAAAGPGAARASRPAASARPARARPSCATGSSRAMSPSSAFRPRPRPAGRLRRMQRSSSVMRQPSENCGRRVDHFARQRDIGLRPGAAMIVDQRRQAVARRLGQADVARDHGVEHDLAEHRADVRATPDRSAGCGDRTSSARRPGSTSPGLKRARMRSTVVSSWLSPPSAKNSHCSGTSSASAATIALIVSRPSDGGQSISTTSHRGRRCAATAVQPVRALVEFDQFDLGARQIDRRRDDVEPRHARRDHGFVERRFADQQVVARPSALGLRPMPRPVDALPCGSRSISSTREPGRGQRGADIDRGRGLADPAFLVGDRDDFHRRSLPSRDDDARVWIGDALFHVKRTVPRSLCVRHSSLAVAPLWQDKQSFRVSASARLQ